MKLRITIPIASSFSSSVISNCSKEEKNKVEDYLPKICGVSANPAIITTTVQSILYPISTVYKNYYN